MQKNILFIFFLFTILSCTHESEKRSVAVHAIPVDAACILESNNLIESVEKLSDTNFWNTLSANTSIKHFENTVQTLDSNLSIYAPYLVNTNPVYLSIHLTGAKSYDWLIVNATNGQEDQIRLLELGLKSLTEIIEHPYSNTIINEFSLENNPIFYSNHNGLLLISKEKVLVEDAIRQLKTENNLTFNKSFNKIHSSSNKKENFNFYLNAKNFDKISQAILLKKSNLNDFAEWFEWDIELYKNGILFSGISISHDSLSQELSYFYENKTQPLNAPKILPKNTAMFAIKSFENFKQYQRKLLDGLTQNHKLNNYNNSLSKYSEETLKEMESWIDSETTWFLAENSNQLNYGIIIDLRNAANTEEYLQLNADSTSSYRGVKTYEWGKLNALNSLSNFEEINTLQNACIIQEQLVITEDLALLKNIINDQIAGHQLYHTKKYIECMDQLDSKSNLTVYIQNPAALNLGLNKLEANFKSFISSYAEELKPFRSFALQFNASEDIIYSNAYLHFDQSKIDQTRAVWATQLEAPILSEISLIKNHYDQKWEIAVQDENFNLYLISTGGEILWKKKLNEAIIGSIEQIDLFKNKKLQLLFNTSERIYLVDRKGRDVKKFPIQLKHSTELPLALFDYEKSRNYRILLSCGTHHYMYDKNGNEIKGWKLNKTKSNAIHPAQHFVVAGKDYILLPEENGTLNILNRKGESRIKVKDKIQFSDNKLQVVKGRTLADTRIVTIDRDGVQQNILFDGTIDNSLQFEFDENIQYSYHNEHHILVEGEDLKVNGTQMNLLHSFDSDMLSQATLYKSNAQQYLSITDLKSSQAYLFRSPNDLVEGFPLYGKTSGIPKDIDLDEKLNFIVGGESGIIYNYAAE